jgi:hypothetical protein
VEVKEPPIGARELTEQERAPIPKTRVVTTELMSGVGLSHRPGTLRYEITNQQPASLRAPQPRGIKAELKSKWLI